MRIMKVVAALVLGLALAAPVAAQSVFPNRTVGILVPFPSGGSTTAITRLLAARLSEKWGQPVIVLNKPGASGIIASEELLRAPADGHMLMLDVNTHAINAVVKGAKLPYDTIKDFAPVGTIYSFELILVANPSVPSPLSEYIKAAKASPGKFSYATADTGGLTHVAAEMFNVAAGIKTTGITYKGSGPALTDVVGGHVHTLFTSPTAALGFVQSGKLNALGISGKTRTPAYPNVPTFAESGLVDFDASAWGGIFARAGTPAPILEKISTDIAEILSRPDTNTVFVGQGVRPFVSTPAEFQALITKDIKRYGDGIKQANLKFEQ